MRTKELIDIIWRYENYISKGNRLLQAKYNIQISPLIAKRQGVIPARGSINVGNDNLIFRFHGLGCRFEFQDIVIDFDYSFDEFVYRGFEISKLFWFVESLSDVAFDLKNKNKFERYLLELEANGYLSKIEQRSIDTYDFRFNIELFILVNCCFKPPIVKEKFIAVHVDTLTSFVLNSDNSYCTNKDQIHFNVFDDLQSVKSYATKEIYGRSNSLKEIWIFYNTELIELIKPK